MNDNIKPVIIIGAPRSGTNMLRDLLIKLDNVKTWPCDEINYIWRHGNVSFPSDEFTKQQATDRVKYYIRKKFYSFKKKSKADVIIEKTCANSLRLEFINEIFPDAKYLFIIRDGIDVIDSARFRWKAKINVRYLLKKSRYIPITDIPYYSLNYLYHRLYKLFSEDNRLAYWGPKLSNMKEITLNKSLVEICALQWKICINNAEYGFKKISPENVLRIKYEDFVCFPKEELIKIANFINKKPEPNLIDSLSSIVSNSSVGKGRRNMTGEDYRKVSAIIKDDLERLGYEI